MVVTPPTGISSAWEASSRKLMVQTLCCPPRYQNMVKRPRRKPKSPTLFMTKAFLPASPALFLWK